MVNQQSAPTVGIRVGHGFDVHAFGPGHSVRLGGVSIPYEMGLIAHSDGDVLLHALCDACLGAVGLGDVGEHFPDTDAAYENADSRVLLQTVMAKVAEEGYVWLNGDLTIVAQKPRLGSYRQMIRAEIARVLAVDIQSVNVKATTTEGLGYLGRREGIACHAVVLLHKANR